MNKANYAALKNLLGESQVASIRMASEALRRKEDQEQGPLGNLSPRELQIMIAIGSGLQPNVASKRLGISPKSFGTYRARVLEKLHIESNAELAILAYELKLVPSVLERFKEEEDEHVARNGAGCSGQPE